MKMGLSIIAAARKINGHGDLKEVDELKFSAGRLKLDIREAKVAPVKMGWGQALPPTFIQGAYAPLKTILDETKYIENGGVLVISGADHLRSDYTDQDRKQLFANAYPNHVSFVEGYLKLTKRYLSRFGFTESEFKTTAEALFENYWHSWRELNPEAARPEQSKFAFVNGLFREIDCANPAVDFDGAIMLANESVAEALGVPKSRQLPVRGIGISQLGRDGPAFIDEISKFTHILEAVSHSEEQAKLNFKELFFSNRAGLSLYTCFPVAPISFLISNGWATSLKDVRPFLKNYSIAPQGGLNLARAPGNNTTLKNRSQRKPGG